MSCGAIWLDRDGKQDRVRRKKPFKPGDQLTYCFAPDLLEKKPPLLKSIHIQKEFSVWSKPRGMTISGSRFCDHLSLKRCIETQHPDKPTCFIVHRLDRFTSGLILVAHNKSTAAQLSKMFRHHDIEKTYHAWSTGKLTSSTAVSSPIDRKEAYSEVTPIQSDDTKSLVRVQIHTGRKHQVRRHLASLGHPIVGDRQYGTKTGVDLQLAATDLRFELNGDKFEFKLNWRDLLEPFL